VGDVDADGDLDVFNSYEGGFSILRTMASGTFAVQCFARDNSGRHVAIGDYTSDGIPDVFAGTRLLVGQGSGMFAAGPIVPGLYSGWCERMDCDGDGRLDVAALGSPGPVVVLRGMGDGTFDIPIPVPFQPQGNIIGLRVADIRDDPRPEIIALASSFSTPASSVYILQNLVPDCNDNGIDDPVEIAQGGSTDCNNNGIPDFCEGDCDNDGALDPCQISADPSQDLDSDGTLDICEISGVPYCFGDGSGTACPCDPGQAGPIGSGCLNSGGSGARLEARGNPSVNLDSITLRVAGTLPTAIGLLFQGNGQQAGGLGGTFGDGLLCVNQNIVRLGVRQASGGLLSFGYGVPGDPTIAAQGQVPMGGATRYYQHWYRDPLPFCTASTFNLTNAVRIDWIP
jgi:hypothetical protein